MSFTKNNSTLQIPLKFLQWNCRGIIRKHSPLVNLTNSHNLSVILLSETHLDPSMNFRLKGYSILRKDHRSNSRGILIAIRENMQPLSCQIECPPSIDAIACSINSSLGVITIVSIYIHPNAAVTARDLERFLDSIPKPFIIGGDWNAKHSLWGNVENNRRGNMVHDVLDSMGLVVLNNGNHTRFDRSRASSAIDLTITTADISLCFCWDTLDDAFCSDHVPIVFEMEITASERSNNSFRRVDWQTYSEEISRRMENLNSASASFETFYDIVIESMASASPTKKVNTCKKIPQPWWDSELESQVRKVRENFRKWKRNGYSVTLYECYAESEHEFKRMVKDKKQKSWKMFCDSLDSDTSLPTLWRMARRFKGKCSDNNQPRDPVLMDELLRRLAPASTLEPIHPRLILESDGNGCQYFSIQDLQQVLDNTKDTSPGLDGISYAALRNLPFSAKQILLGIYNEIFHSGDIPESWKVFNIVTILKPGQRSDSAKSYRPIALASCFRKVLELLIKERVEWLMEAEGYFSEEICGFRKGKGTQDALHAVINTARKAIANRQHALFCMLDIRSAYDCVNINLLVDELLRWNIPVHLVRIIYFLFRERKLSIQLTGTISNTRTTWIGLPQGSPLSPICFNIFINNVVKNGAARQGLILVDFADDMSLITIGDDVGNSEIVLQEALDGVVSDLADIGLDISPSKCSTLLFSSRKPACDPKLIIGNIEVPHEYSAKFLGLYLTPTLSWNRHIQYLKQRVSSYVNFLRSVAGQSWGSHPLVLLKIYKSCIRPIVEYGAMFFADCPEWISIQLDRIQWKCIRVCIGSTKTTHTQSLEVLSGLMPLKIRREISADNFVNKRFSLRKWYEAYAAPVIAKNDASCAISRSILKMKETLPDDTLLLDNLPCYLYGRQTVHHVPKIDLSMHAVTANQNSNWNQEVEDIVSTRYRDFICVATDGSKCDEDVGTAVVSNVFPERILRKLPICASVYNAELFGLQCAVQGIAELMVGKFIILTDSMSSLSRLLSNTVSSSTPRMWFEIRKSLKSLLDSGYDVVFMWVPAHKGVVMNEEADKAAKEASVNGIQCSAELTSLDIRLSATNAMSAWQHMWDSSEKGRLCHAILPTVRTTSWFSGELWSRREVVILCKLMSNHSRLPAHLHRNGILQSSECSCGAAEATPNHIFFECEIFEESECRRQLWIALIRRNVPPDVVTILKRRIIFVMKCLCEFIISNQIDM